MLWQYCYTCSQIAGSRKDSTGIHDEMAQSVCNRKHAQERTVTPTGTESCASLLNRKQVTGSANPNSVRDTPRLRGRLLSGSTRHTVSVHVPVHNERQTTANEPKTFNNVHCTHTHTLTHTHTHTHKISYERGSCFLKKKLLSAIQFSEK